MCGVWWLGVGGGNGMGGVCVVCGDGRNNINVWLMGRQLQGEFREKIDNNYLRSSDMRITDIYG